jgi:hypothetical protein
MEYSLGGVRVWSEWILAVCLAFSWIWITLQTCLLCDLFKGQLHWWYIAIINNSSVIENWIMGSKNPTFGSTPTPNPDQIVY